MFYYRCPVADSVCCMLPFVCSIVCISPCYYSVYITVPCMHLTYDDGFALGDSVLSRLLRALSFHKTFGFSLLDGCICTGFFLASYRPISSLRLCAL